MLNYAFYQNLFKIIAHKLNLKHACGCLQYLFSFFVMISSGKYIMMQTISAFGDSAFCILPAISLLPYYLEVLLIESKRKTGLLYAGLWSDFVYVPHTIPGRYSQRKRWPCVKPGLHQRWKFMERHGRVDLQFLALVDPYRQISAVRF